MDDPHREEVPPVSAENLVAGEPVGDPEVRRYPSTLGGACYLVILAVAVVGLVLVVTTDWRLGIRVVAGALAAAALCRLALPEKDAGMLAVRHRALDALMLAGTAAVLGVLASNIPDQPGA